MSLTGSSQEIPLVDVLQVAANNRQTSRITVRAEVGQGELFLDQGELVHATCGSLRGEEAAWRLLAAERASYRVEAGGAARERTIHRSCTHVIMESARVADELARGSVMTPLPAPLPAIEFDARSRGRSIWPWAALAMLALAAGLGGAWWMTPARPAGPIAPVAEAAVAPPVAAVEAAELTGPGDAAPIARDTPSPRAPVTAALAPTIVCRVLVDGRGAVADAKIYRSRLDLAAWEDAALYVVSGWTFTPGKRAGVPIATWISVGVGFVARDAVTARIAVKGSDTIGGAHGVGQDLARAYEAAHPGVIVTWEGLGSSTAFPGLLDGSAELGASSRPVKASELAEASRLGVTLVEHVLGYDGVAIVVHPDAPVRELTIEQAGRVFRGEVASWAELGGPDLPIRRLSRPSYSGTHTFFRDQVVHGEFAAGTEWIEASEQIVAAVAADPAAIGYVGLSWVTDAVRALAIDGVTPAVATVRDGRYPIYRPLLLYTRGAPPPEVAALVRFAGSSAGQALLTAKGFVAAELTAEPEPTATASSAPPKLALRVTFGAGRAALDLDDRRALWKLGAELAARPRRVLVIGHADADGAADVNAAVARRRAEAVVAYLRRAGVDPAIIVTSSDGADAPAASNTSAAGRRQNRRVDVLVAPE